MENDKSDLICLPDGPYNLIKGKVKNSKKVLISDETDVYLCRCGGSGDKPFCDGTHLKNGFNSKKISDGKRDKRDNYTGKTIVIHDNRAICAHSGICTDNLPEVFRLNQKPWIEPDEATAELIIETIKNCPSGALSYSIDNVEYRDYLRNAEVTVTKNGPYAVTGAVNLCDEEKGDCASDEHYTLCRCGCSDNKPFCDGTHWTVEFKDEKNQ